MTEADAHCSYGYVSMADGVHLAYAVWRRNEGSSYPAVLNYSAYFESGAVFDHACRFLNAGYAYVGANVRGTGASEGEFSYFQPIEAEDGATLVEWIASQAWCDGNVGMVGPSYGAHTQIAVAARRPPHLKAIIPISVDGNEYQDEAMPGGLCNVGMLATWALDFQPKVAAIGVAARYAAGDERCREILQGQRPNPTFDEARQHPLYDDWWHSRSLDALIDRVTVPTLFIQAWQDEYIRPNGALRLFRLLRSEHKRLCLQNGPHRLSNYRMNQIEQMRWLERWVKGRPSGIERELPVIVHWEVKESASEAVPGWTTSYSDWPVPSTEWHCLHLTASGGLSVAQSAEPADLGERRFVYPLGVELLADSEQFKTSPLAIGTLNYCSEPLSADLVILGVPQLVFHISSDQSDTALMFTLKDVGSNGNVLFLQRTVLRASLRVIDDELSTPNEVMQSFKTTQELVPGIPTEIRLSLAALGHVVRQGHRLQLSIGSPSTALSPIWAFAPELPAAVNTLHHSERHPAKLLLPILPSERASQPVTPGVLRNQPWRAARTQPNADSA